MPLSGSGAVFQKGVILHVDDDAGVVRVIARVLESNGYRVSSVYSVADGLRQLKVVKPDLVILDMQLQGMSGTTFLRQVASQASGTTPVPILVLSAFQNRISDEVKSLAAGLLLKPVSPEMLIAEVDRILGWK